MKKKDIDALDKKAADVDEAMLFIVGCNRNKIFKDLEHQTALECEQYPCDIESACNLKRS